MGIFRRVSDIISANLNEMVEKFESPETMLRQAIREMDAAVARTMEAAARVIADERLLDSQLARHRDESSDLYRRAQELLLRGDEPAARRALVRRNECEKIVAALDDQLTAARTTGGKIRRQLDAMRVRRAEAQRSCTCSSPGSAPPNRRDNGWPSRPNSSRMMPVSRASSASAERSNGPKPRLMRCSNWRAWAL
jgi:phage shock protein A